MFLGGNSVRNASSGSVVSADHVAALTSPVIPAVGLYPASDAVNAPAIS
jgi:hypothetical protein